MASRGRRIFLVEDEEWFMFEVWIDPCCLEFPGFGEMMEAKGDG